VNHLADRVHRSWPLMQKDLEHCEIESRYPASVCDVWRGRRDS
jgi:hypothetical protein